MSLVSEKIQEAWFNYEIVQNTDHQIENSAAKHLIKLLQERVEERKSEPSEYPEGYFDDHWTPNWEESQ